MNKNQQLSLSFPGVLTMTSREIAELVDQRHDNVKRTIETLSAAGTITPPQFEEVPNTGPGPRTINIHRLDKRSSLIVVAQLCPAFTARIVDRWQELEDKLKATPKPAPVAAPAVPRALANARRMLKERDAENAELRAQLNRLTMAAPASARLTVQEMVRRAPDVFCCSQWFSAAQAAQAARMVSA